eukprot:gene12132-8353_t
MPSSESLAQHRITHGIPPHTSSDETDHRFMLEPPTYDLNSLGVRSVCCAGMPENVEGSFPKSASGSNKPSMVPALQRDASTAAPVDSRIGSDALRHRGAPFDDGSPPIKNPPPLPGVQILRHGPNWITAQQHLAGSAKHTHISLACDRDSDTSIPAIRRERLPGEEGRKVYRLHCINDNYMEREGGSIPGVKDRPVGRQTSPRLQQRTPFPEFLVDVLSPSFYSLPLRVRLLGFEGFEPNTIPPNLDSEIKKNGSELPNSSPFPSVHSVEGRCSEVSLSFVLVLVPLYLCGNNINRVVTDPYNTKEPCMECGEVSVATGSKLFDL